jgi:geranylgeranyl diphosphate synthase type II
MTSFADYVRDRRARVDAALERSLPAAPPCPPLIVEAMRYSLMAGGKRLRPVLAIAAAEAVHERLTGDSSEPSLAAACEAALPAACALEYIHTYSLIHDDLPAMDNDTLRRGRPTSHVVFGEGVAILAGDALLTHAFGILGECRAPIDRTIRAIAVIARAAGAAGMVGGQVIDLEAVGPRIESGGLGVSTIAVDESALETMHAMKTGALIRASAVAGAVLGGGTPTLVDAADRFAADLGLAFQIVDDLLDVESSAAEIGKTAGKDAASGKPTYPALYGVEESRRRAAECVTRARQTLHDAGLAGRLPDFADWVVSRKS